MSRDWVAIRQEVRLLCHEVGVALETGQGLDAIRPRPGDCGPALQAIFNALAEWPWPGPPCLSSQGTEPPDHELSLYELIYAVCKSADLSPGLIWGTLLELIDAEAMRPLVRKPTIEPRQQNLWVRFGSGSRPRLCNRASFATTAVRTPYDFLVTSFTVLLRPSTAPAETVPLARNQFRINGR
jgi:hypothetical protein